MPVQYIPTTQSPLQGNNLPNVVNALKGNNTTIPMNNMLNSSPSNPLSNSMSSLGQSFNSDGGPSSTYGGFNYGNNYAPGLTGQNLSQAAQAGVQSGLTFNPSTGTIS